MSTADPPPPGPVDGALLAAAGGPRSVTADGLTVEQYSITELIALDQYLAAKAAMGLRSRGLRFNRIVPGGTVRPWPYPSSSDWLWGYGFATRRYRE